MATVGKACARLVTRGNGDVGGERRGGGMMRPWCMKNEGERHRSSLVIKGCGRGVACFYSSVHGLCRCFILFVIIRGIEGVFVDMR